MTASFAIEVRNLSKRYRRGKITARTLREDLEILVSRLRSKEAPVSSQEFYALSDVTFSVPVGAVCGIIGRNGSGKTTLLKVLASITAPDAGEAVLRGRIGTLLEVGAGFHPELDGIENIYLNGAILGMSRSEITHKLDQIIEFADIGEFLETPVKRYSSGMYVRLAFSIAAHLEPEILVVDEVLAVGDADFQRKSLGKMKNVAHDGRTVLFVTHNMAMARQLCNMAVHLNQGAVQNIGDSSTVIDAYLARLVVPSGSGSGRGGDESLWAELSIVEPGKQVSCAHLTFGRDYDFKLRIGSKHQFRRAVAHVKLFDQDANLVSRLESLAEGIDQFNFIGIAEVVFNVRAIGLMPGVYWADFELYVWGEDHPTLFVEKALDFEIIAANVNDALWPYSREHGIVRVASSATLRTSI